MKTIAPHIKHSLAGIRGWVLFTVLLGSLFSACQRQPMSPYTVQYSVASPGRVDVRFTNPDGQTGIVENARTPWSYGFDAPEDGRVVRLTASSLDGSPVTASIFINGQEVSRGNSSSGFVALNAELP